MIEKLRTKQAKPFDAPQEALDFYDRALKAGSAVPELQFPVMTYVGKSNALIKLGRIDEADAIVSQAVGKAEALPTITSAAVSRPA